ncbi:hypothetical protein LINPERHAP2_LOCUS29331, partial [Linum perenne]
MSPSLLETMPLPLLLIFPATPSSIPCSCSLQASCSTSSE